MRSTERPSSYKCNTYVDAAHTAFRCPLKDKLILYSKLSQLIIGKLS